MTLVPSHEVRSYFVMHLRDLPTLSLVLEEVVDLGDSSAIVVSEAMMTASGN